MKDVVKGIIEISQNPDATGELFNIGSTEEITIENLANLVKKLTKSSSKIVFIPYDDAYEEGFEDMRKRVPNISKIQKLTSYKPSINIEHIIITVIEYYKNK